MLKKTNNKNQPEWFLFPILTPDRQNEQVGYWDQASGPQMSQWEEYYSGELIIYTSFLDNFFIEGPFRIGIGLG